MARTRIRFRFAAFEELRREPGVVADLQRRTNAVAAAAGAGYLPSVQQGDTRARGSVITATSEARLDNARHNTLLRALDAGRG